MSGSNGELYILEINTVRRHDPQINKVIDGVGLTKFTDVCGNYNVIAARHLYPGLLTKNLAHKTQEFLDQHRHISFPTGLKPFLSPWLGINLGGKSPNQMFCSELCVAYYKFIFGVDDTAKLFGHVSNSIGIVSPTGFQE